MMKDAPFRGSWLPRLAGCTALVLAMGLAPAAHAGEGAKSLFYRQLQDPTKVQGVGFTYSIELVRNGHTAKVDNRHSFKNGDQIRFHVQPSIDGFMYMILTEGAGGGKSLLFPAPGSPENNNVKHGQDYILPEFGTLTFDDHPGVEMLKLVLSKTKLADADKTSRGIVIASKGETAPQAKIMLDFAAKANSEVKFSSDHPPSFSSEPAVTVASSDTTKPLAVDLQLTHDAGVGKVAALPPKTTASTAQDKTKTRATNTPAATQSLGSPAETKLVQDKWALVVGISKFKDPRWNLMYPEKDARDFANFLVSECRFAQDHVKLLTDDEATREAILTDLGSTWLPANAKENDLVLVYFASHGTSSDQDVARKNFLVAYDTNPANPFATGIEMQDLARTIKRRINAKRVVILLDTCHSGAAEPGAKALGGPPVRPFDFQELFQGTGQLIVASASSNQKAHDSLRYSNGIFTKHLMDGIRTKQRFADAFKYTQDKVADEALNDFKDPQTPVLKDAEWKGEALQLAAPPANPRQVSN